MFWSAVYNPFCRSRLYQDFSTKETSLKPFCWAKPLLASQIEVQRLVLAQVVLCRLRARAPTAQILASQEQASTATGGSFERDGQNTRVLRMKFMRIPTYPPHYPPTLPTCATYLRYHDRYKAGTNTSPEMYAVALTSASQKRLDQADPLPKHRPRPCCGGKWRV